MSESSMSHKVCSSTLVPNILMTILMIKSQAENGGQRIIKFDFLFFIKASVQWVYMNFYTYSKKKSVLRITFVTDYNAFDKLYNHVFKQVIILFSKLLWLSTFPKFFKMNTVNSLSTDTSIRWTPL